MTDNLIDKPASVSDRLRRALAFPLYVVSLTMCMVGDLLGIVAAKIAGDDWPR
jgi:hypothetical protein